MTPLPAVLGTGVNLLGDRFRKADAAVWQVILVAVGVFLSAMAGSWVIEGLPLGGQNGIREAAWATLGNLGLCAISLAAMRLFKTAEVVAQPLTGQTSLEEFKRLLKQ